MVESSVPIRIKYNYRRTAIGVGHRGSQKVRFLVDIIEALREAGLSPSEKTTQLVVDIKGR